MIRSIFIKEILTLYTQYYTELSLLKEQIKHLEEKDYEYTDAGFFLDFKYDSKIYDYQIETNLIYSGPIINSSELIDGAETLLRFKNGIVCYIEIFSRNSDYPKRDLADYHLTEF